MRKRILLWATISVVVFLLGALVPVVPVHKGDRDAPLLGRFPLLLFYLGEPARDLPLLWPYVLGHLGVTTLVAAQIASRRRGADPPSP
jgi:hypothetical protein